MAAARPLEQLQYTWARRGLSGINQFQIYSASPGLRGGTLMRSVRGVVESLCRYVPPGDHGALPVSYGWIDHDRFRIAFSRVGLPPPQPREGNFAVHLVIGPTAELPAHEIAARFESPFWWHGLGPEALEDGAEDRVPDELPTLSLAAIQQVANTGPPRSADYALAHALATRPERTRLLVVGDSYEIGRSLRRIAAAVPFAFEGTSLSTYEREPAFPYSVVGAPPAALTPHTTHRTYVLGERADLDTESLATLERLFGNEGHAWTLREACTSIAHTNGGGGRLAAWQTARTLVEAGSGKPVETERLTKAMASGSALRLLMRGQVTRRRIADALREAHSAVATALKSNGAAADPQDVQAFAEELADNHIGAATLAGCSMSAARLAACFPATEASFLDRLLTAASDPTLAATLDPPDAQRLAKRAAELTIPSQDILDLLRRVDLDAIRSLPEAYRTDVIGLRLERARGDPRSMAQAIRDNAAVTGRMQLTEDQARGAEALVEELSGRDLRLALEGLVVPLSARGRSEFVADALRRLPRDEASQCLAVAARYAIGDPPSVVSDLCLHYAADLIDERFTQSYESVMSDHNLPWELLDRSDTPDGATARQVLESLTPATLSCARTGEALREANEAETIEYEPLRSVIGQLALTTAITHLRDYGDVWAIWGALCRHHPYQVAASLVRRLMAAAACNDSGLGNAVLLSWLAVDMPPSWRPGFSRRGQLEDERLQNSCERAAQIATHPRLGAYDEVIASCTKEIRRWWATLQR